MKTALYRHFDEAGQLLYVGISLNSMKRLRQHSAKAHWFTEISRVEIEWLPTREQAIKAEAKAIHHEKPKWNVVRPRHIELRPVPIPSSSNPVPLQGEELGEVYWQGVQWAVTEDGIECRDGTYFIAAHRLRDEEPQYSWMRHMAEKDWVNLSDFNVAFAVACYVHLGEKLVIPDLKPRKPFPSTPEEIWFMENMVIQMPRAVQ